MVIHEQNIHEEDQWMDAVLHPRMDVCCDSADRHGLLSYDPPAAVGKDPACQAGQGPEEHGVNGLKGDEAKMKKKKDNVKNNEIIAKEICDYLAGNMDKKVTINELAAMLHVSATQLKVTFKSVSGSSIYAYQRKQKMLAAADDLCRTDDSVLKIAGKYGYENGSKFAKAFRDTFGMSPSMYRKTNKMPA